MMIPTLPSVSAPTFSVIRKWRTNISKNLLSIPTFGVDPGTQLFVCFTQHQDLKSVNECWRCDYSPIFSTRMISCSSEFSWCIKMKNVE